MMKVLTSVLIVALLIPAFYACNNDDDYYSLDDMWITIGNIEGDINGFVVVSDNGERLYPSVNMVPWYPVKNGDRLWVNYTILGDGEAGKDIDHYVRINFFEDILTKDILLLTPDNADSIGHDPVWVNDQEEDIWIANNYLNIFFVYEGDPWIVHYINVVSDTENPTAPDGTPVLELRHNKNGDPNNENQLTGFVSINLKSLQEDGKDSVKFIIRAMGDDGNYSLDKEFTYVYDPNTIADETVSLRTIPANTSVK